MQHTTNYTTYDLRYYFADLMQYPRVSKVERDTLITTLPASEMLSTSPSAQALEVKARLIEMHLGMALHEAVRVCPHELSATLLPDLVQEANLAVLCAVEHYDWSAGGDITNYILTWIQGRLKDAFVGRHLITINKYGRQHAKATGTSEQLYAIQPVSLDRLFGDDDEDSGLYQLIEAPSPMLCTQQDEHKRTHLDKLLSYLSVHAQAVLRLRYGLYYEEDERPRTLSEIACELGMSKRTVRILHDNALRRLRAFVAGEATLIKYRGRVCISLSTRERAYAYTYQFLLEHPDELFFPAPRTPHANPTAKQRHTEQESIPLLEAAYADLCAKGERISGRVLAKLVHVSRPHAVAFLRTKETRYAAA